ncbi:MAG: hypothetical protein K0S81_1265 [Rhodospirillales bacterium]|jgi:hypothetical protein|nr:hypothetical protein [Rhodospirillales bacterium]
MRGLTLPMLAQPHAAYDARNYGQAGQIDEKTNSSRPNVKNQKQSFPTQQYRAVLNSEQRFFSTGVAEGRQECSDCSSGCDNL